MAEFKTYYRYEKNPFAGDLIWSDEMDRAWPLFMKQDPIANEYFTQSHDLFPETVFYICDGDSVIVRCQSIPVIWDGQDATLPDEGWDWAISSGVENKKAGKEANTLCALEVAIHPDYRGQGLSQVALTKMRQIGIEKGYKSLIAPVRPSQKHLYPLIDMARYISWKREDVLSGDSLSFDPWLRTHERMGARIIKVCPQSMKITGTVAEWEEWTGMRFPDSGEHIVPLAVNPVVFDIEKDTGTYIEPNVWMLHPIK